MICQSLVSISHIYTSNNEKQSYFAITGKLVFPGEDEPCAPVLTEDELDSWLAAATSPDCARLYDLTRDRDQIIIRFEPETPFCAVQTGSPDYDILIGWEAECANTFIGLPEFERVYVSEEQSNSCYAFLQAKAANFGLDCGCSGPSCP